MSLDARILATNLEALAERCPQGAQRIRSGRDDSVSTLDTPSGPLLVVGGLPQENTRNPARSASRWARDAQTCASDLLVLGCGSGFHLEALRRETQARIHLVEPRLAVLRAWLASRDQQELLRGLHGLFTDVAEIPNRLLAEADVLVHGPSRAAGGAEFAACWKALQHSQLQSRGPLRIAVVGPRYGGSLPMARHAAAAFRTLGHEVQYVDFTGFQESWLGLGKLVPDAGRRRVLEDAHTELLGAALVENLRENPPDLLFALAQAPLDVAALQAIGDLGIPRALWFVEDYRLFDYWQRVAPHYDHVFVIQEEAAAQLRAAGCASASYLPAAFSPDVHRPMVLNDQERALYGSDVSFVGAGYANRRASLPAFAEFDFRVWGSDWDGAEGFSRILQRGGARIDEEECVRIFQASAVNLNLHSSTWCRGVDPRGDFLNPRTFEIAGCGAFQVVDQRSHLERHFKPGEEICVVPDVETMKEATAYYLAHPEERARIAAAGRRRALAEHRYEDRMREALRELASSLPLFGSGSREGSIGALRDRAPEPLASWLRSLDPDQPLSLEVLAGEIARGEGDLEEAEGVVLFLQQFSDLYLGESRP